MNSSTLHHPTTTAIHHLTTSSKRHRSIPIFTPSSSSRRHLRRHLRRNLKKKPLPTTTPPPFPTTATTSSAAQDHTLQSSDYLNTLLFDSKLFLNQFIKSSQDAIDDLKTLIVFDNRNNYNSIDGCFDHNYNGYSYNYGDSNGHRRVVVSCKRSTVEFLWAVLISSFVVVYTVNVVLNIGKVLFSSWKNNGVGEGKVVYKRDRSLGGKLVAVGSSDGEYSSVSGYGSEKGDEGSFWDLSDEVKEWRRGRGRGAGLPKWWPKENARGIGVGGMADEDEKKEYQNLANRFIRGCLLALCSYPLC